MRAFLFAALASLSLLLSGLAAAQPPAAVNAILERDGTLIVSGTGEADDVVLRLGAAGALEVDDRSNGPEEDFSFPLDRVVRIRVTVGAGDDRVVLDDSGGTLEKPFEIRGGPGADRLFASTGGLSPEAAEALFFALQEADDLAARREEIETRGSEILTGSPLLVERFHRDVVAVSEQLAGEGDALFGRGEALAERLDRALGEAARRLRADPEDDAVEDAVETDLDAVEGEVDAFEAEANAFAERVERELEGGAEAFTAFADETVTSPVAVLEGLVEALEARAEILSGLVDAVPDEGGGASFKTELASCELEGEKPLDGGDGNDFLVGTFGSDEIDGGKGDDWIFGLGGGDEIRGGEGNDRIFGMGGGDRINGNAGRDLILGNRGEDCLFGDEATDVVLGNADRDEIEGGAGNDLLAGSTGDDVLKGGEGRDLILGGPDEDEIEGNEGIDFLFGGPHDDTMYGHAGETIDLSQVQIGPVQFGKIHIGNLMLGQSGMDTMEGEDGIDVMLGGPDPDPMKGGRQVDLMWGQGEDDDMRGEHGEVLFTVYGVPIRLGNLMFGDPGMDIMRGGPDPDGMFGGRDSDWMHGGQGFVWLSLDQDWMFGNDGPDWMDGAWGNDWMFGGRDEDDLRGDNSSLVMLINSHDWVFGGRGADQVRGGRGQDKLFGNRGSDEILGGNGWDVLFGNREGDRIDGGRGRDLAFGNRGNDLVQGGRGRDFLFGNSGDDTLDGGKRKDLLAGNRGNDLVQGGRGWDILAGNRGNDHLIGGRGWDLGFGNRDCDRVEGNQGLDVLFGNRGVDRVEGGPGLDVLYGNRDDDMVWGGSGLDRISGGRGNDSLFGEGGPDWMRGHRGDDCLHGGSWPDTMRGGDGNDCLDGGAGPDRLHGNDGDDVLLGGAGWDLLQGDQGDDRLDGGAGVDFLTGGQGSDELWGGPALDLLLGEKRHQKGNSGLTCDCREIPCSEPQLPTTGCLEGRKVLDRDGDGVADPGEPGLPGWSFEVTSGTATWTVATDAQGALRLCDLSPGVYTVGEGAQEGWIPTNGAPRTVTVQAGQTASVPAFLNFACFTDLNGDGVPDPGEIETCRGDLGIEKRCTNEDILTCELFVTNLGNAPVSPPIVVTDTLPYGLQLTGSTGTGWSCTGDGKAPETVTCTYAGPVLLPGQKLPPVRISTSYNPPAVSAHRPNCARVRHPGDLETWNDERCVSPCVPQPDVFYIHDDPVACRRNPVFVHSCRPGSAFLVDGCGCACLEDPELPDLKIGKTCRSAEGRFHACFLTIENVGTAPAHGIQVVDVLPAGIGFVSSPGGFGPGWECRGDQKSPETVVCELNESLSLAPGGTLTVTIPVSGEIPSGVRNCAEVRSWNAEANLANNFACYEPQGREDDTLTSDWSVTASPWLFESVDDFLPGVDLEQGRGFTLGLERRLFPELGIEAGLSRATVDVRQSFVREDRSFTRVRRDDLLSVHLGLDLHLSPHRPVDLTFGTFLAWLRYPELEGAGRPADDLALGLALGVEFPLGESRWSLRSSLRALVPVIDLGSAAGRDVSFSPLSLDAGVRYRLGGTH